MTKKKSPKDFTEKDYERLGRTLVSIGELGVADKKHLYWSYLVKGMLYGFGGVVGATILISLMLWGLSLFDQIPLVDQFVDSIERTVEEQR